MHTKKYVLVSLIVSGQVSPVPKFTSTVVQRSLKNTCGPYQEFATAYSTHSTDDVHKCAVTHSEQFQKDGNFGLVKQSIQMLYKANIKRHTQTYLTLSLQDIADSTKMTNRAEAETVLLKMIEEQDLYATINQRDGMVAFQDDPEAYNTNKMMVHLDRQLGQIISLDKKLRTVDELIALTPNYVQKISGHERLGRFAVGDFDDSGFTDMDKGGFPATKF